VRQVSAQGLQTFPSLKYPSGHFLRQELRPVDMLMKRKGALSEQLDKHIFSEGEGINPVEQVDTHVKDDASA
jgi:hypothetical protein